MAEERGLSVDTARFEERMEAAREKSRAAAAGTDARKTLPEIVQKENLISTDFRGYDSMSLNHRGRALVYVETPTHYDRVEKASVGDRVAYGPVLGAYASIRNVPAGRVVKIPDGVSAQDPQGRSQPLRPNQAKGRKGNA